MWDVFRSLKRCIELSVRYGRCESYLGSVRVVREM